MRIYSSKMAFISAQAVTQPFDMSLHTASQRKLEIDNFGSLAHDHGARLKLLKARPQPIQYRTLIDRMRSHNASQITSEPPHSLALALNRAHEQRPDPMRQVIDLGAQFLG